MLNPDDTRYIRVISHLKIIGAVPTIVGPDADTIASFKIGTDPKTTINIEYK